MTVQTAAQRPLQLWGSELSPFTLKLRALLDYAAVPYRVLPADGGRLENYRALTRIQWATLDSTMVALRLVEARTPQGQFVQSATRFNLYGR